ncbi:hypothetical protein ACLQ29_11665 [Micromonospora sp. DT228]|uniref:hypothetical protein n=1 Tax=Micromonospora sp. DT228 TaxID=3393443 RepID=UPI003CF4E136
MGKSETTPYVEKAAFSALQLLRFAQDQWEDGMEEIQATRFRGDVTAPTLKQYGHVVNVLAMARGLDDMGAARC